MAGQSPAEMGPVKMGIYHSASITGGEMGPLDGPNTPTLKGLNHADDFVNRSLRQAPGATGQSGGPAQLADPLAPETAKIIEDFAQTIFQAG